MVRTTVLGNPWFNLIVMIFIVLTSLGEKLTEKEVDDLLKCVDVDKHGYVNYATFVKTVLSG